MVSQSTHEGLWQGRPCQVRCVCRLVWQGQQGLEFHARTCSAMKCNEHRPLELLRLCSPQDRTQPRVRSSLVA